MKKLLIGAFSMAALVSTASADDPMAALKGDGKYGAAGCGLGSMVFHQQKGIIQVVAATINGTAGNQTFAMSTGTLNCYEDGVALKDKEQEVFASANFESLHQEMAQGHGESLNAFAYLFGCEGSGVEKFSEAARSNFSEIFPSEKTDYSQMLGNVQGMVKSNPDLRASCGEKG